MEKIVVFQLEEQFFGVDIKQVNSIERLLPINHIPQMPTFMKGVINLRGDIIPIVDLKEKLKIGETESKKETRILIVSVNNVQLGLLVDAATDVFDIDSSVIDTSSNLYGESNRFISGIVKLDDKLLILLDVESLLQSDMIHQVKELIETAK